MREAKRSQSLREIGGNKRKYPPPKKIHRLSSGLHRFNQFFPPELLIGVCKYNRSEGRPLFRDIIAYISRKYCHLVEENHRYHESQPLLTSQGKPGGKKAINR